MIHQRTQAVPTNCKAIRAQFSAYLDGAVSGVEMTSIADHFNECSACHSEFAAWRSVQTALADLGRAKAPARLQARLRNALAIERERGTNLSWPQQAVRIWDAWLGETSARLAGGLAAAIILLGSAAQFLASNTPVMANDDNLAHLVGPRYLYSQVPPRPLETKHGAPVLVQAKVNEHGRVYDYNIIAGPSDSQVRLRVEENLLSSVFRPATAFGVPVAGQVIMTYSGVSVRG